MSGCVDCFRNCPDIISDRCVKYTGPDITCLGICTGDSLYEFEAEVAEKLCAAIDGTGIDLSSVDVSCEFLTDILGEEDQTLVNLMQMLITASCTLKELIDEINAQLAEQYVFNTLCLENLPTSPTKDDIIQAAINKICAIDARLLIIENDYVKNSDLCTLVTACLSGGGGGGGTPSSQYKDRMVPYAPIPYIGPLSNFDNTGIGLSANGFDKVYLMNGLNGTQDWRGRSPIGAINNVPGGTLDSAVDPSLPANAGLNYNLNQKVGASSVTLSVIQMPAHTHGVNDPGHKHQITGYVGGGTSEFAAGTGNFWYRNPYTSTSTTGITLQSAGAGQPHTNLQPSIACYYIVHIP